MSTLALRRVCVVVVVASALVGCGEASGPARSLTQSQALLTEPPETTTIGVAGDWGWSATSASDVVEFIPVNGGSHATLDAGSEQNRGILFARTVEIGTTTFLVLGVLHADETMTFYRYNDTVGADGVPDRGSRVTLFSTPAEVYITSAAFDWDGGRAYLLDRRCGDILLARDTNADGWVDSLSTVPFAMRTTYPDLENARCIRVEATGRVLVFNYEAGHLVPRDSVAAHYVYADTNGDDVANSITRVDGGLEGPFHRGSFYDGQLDALVYGTSGLTAEIWSLDSEHEPQDMLGSGSIDATGAAVVTLSRALDEGEQIGVRYSTPTEMRTHVVYPAWPDIVSTEPDFVYRGSSAQATVLHGNSFSAAMTVWLRDPGGTLHALIPTITSSHEASVSIPATAFESDGSAYIYALLPTQSDPLENGAHVRCIRVCDADGE